MPRANAMQATRDLGASSMRLLPELERADMSPAYPQPFLGRPTEEIGFWRGEARDTDSNRPTGSEHDTYRLARAPNYF